MISTIGKQDIISKYFHQVDEYLNIDQTDRVSKARSLASRSVNFIIKTNTHILDFSITPTPEHVEVFTSLNKINGYYQVNTVKFNIKKLDLYKLSLAELLNEFNNIPADAEPNFVNVKLRRFKQKYKA